MRILFLSHFGNMACSESAGMPRHWVLIMINFLLMVMSRELMISLRVLVLGSIAYDKFRQRMHNINDSSLFNIECPYLNRLSKYVMTQVQIQVLLDKPSAQIFDYSNKKYHSELGHWDKVHELLSRSVQVGPCNGHFHLKF